MSVEVGRPMIRLTDNAVAKLKEMLAEQGDTELCLRVFIQSGGCDGYSYGMTLILPKRAMRSLRKAASACWLTRPARGSCAVPRSTMSRR